MIKNYNEKIGCFWLKQNDKGEYMSGELLIDGEKHKIVAFRRDKRNDREPDWDIKFSKPKEEGINTKKVDEDTFDEIIS
jgi:hypothetical protein